MNDPAVLFYTSDFLTGVIDMTMEERGQYITLLCYQHQRGHIKEETIRLLVGLPSVNVLNHFKKDDEGLFYNERMDIEKEKRHNFTNSRRENGKKGGRPKEEKKEPKENLMDNLMDNHKGNLMGNENDNDNINSFNNNIYKDIIDYLNLKTGQHYKYSTPKTKTLIKARLNEDFTLNDFKIVIDNMCIEWFNSDMKKYLRPETLFGTKFESYLNRQVKITSKNINLTSEEISNLFN